MQITPELLRKYAESAVEKQTQTDYTVIAVYLTGAMVVEENPFLGGTADIDLTFIHIGEPEASREIQKVNDDVHIDISHHSQSDYLDRIGLRTHPWMGPILSEAIALYDPQHFLDITQASVRGLFHHPGNVAQRAQVQIDSAREGWYKFQPVPEDPGLPEVMAYLDILDSAANAVALLVGEPLTERRFLINFPKRLERIGRPGLAHGLLGMLGAPKVDKQILSSWVGEWEKIFNALPLDERHPRLHPFRCNYYFRAFNTILGTDQPENVLWPLLRTWSLAAHDLPENSLGYQGWKDACTHLGYLGSGFAERILALDAFLEQVEETVSQWREEDGA
jgi:hypothetical protein